MNSLACLDIRYDAHGLASAAVVAARMLDIEIEAERDRRAEDPPRIGMMPIRAGRWDMDGPILRYEDSLEHLLKQRAALAEELHGVDVWLGAR